MGGEAADTVLIRLSTFLRPLGSNGFYTSPADEGASFGQDMTAQLTR